MNQRLLKKCLYVYFWSNKFSLDEQKKLIFKSDQKSGGSVNIYFFNFRYNQKLFKKMVNYAFNSWTKIRDANFQ